MPDVMNRFKIKYESDEYGGSVSVTLDGVEVFAVAYGPTTRANGTTAAMLEAFSYEPDEESVYRLDRE